MMSESWRLCNKAESTLELIVSLTLFFQEIYDCEAIGVRLRDGDDFPYYETRNSINRTTRNIMGTLRPTGLDDLDLLAALNHHINIFLQRTGMAVSFEVDDFFPRLTGDKEIVLFRIIQESPPKC